MADIWRWQRWGTTEDWRGCSLGLEAMASRMADFRFQGFGRFPVPMEADHQIGPQDSQTPGDGPPNSPGSPGNDGGSVPEFFRPEISQQKVG